jgi:hypothetical protein
MAIQLRADEQVFSIPTSVYFKLNWGDDWIYAPNIQPLSASLAAAPAMGTATFKVRYGEGFWENYEQMTDGDELISFTYCYIQIRGRNGKDEFILWTGVVPAEKFMLLGKTARSSSADQIIQAYGLDWLLETRLNGGWVHSENSAVLIDYLPTFNRRHEYGGDIVGNRSALAVELNGKISYVFANNTETPATWSVLDIVDYLLERYQFDNGPQFILSASDKVVDTLLMIENIYDFNNVTLRQALNALFNRNRGFSWRYNVDVEGTVTLEPFTVIDENIAVGGGVTLPANNSKVSLELWEDKLKTTVEVTLDISSVFDEITVRGSKMKTCCTLYFSGNILQGAWTDAEETTYKNAAKDVAGYSGLSDTEKAELNDRFRSAERFGRVFTTFRINPAWNWKTLDGIWWRITNPKLNSAGDVVYNAQANYWNFDKRILNYLPFKVGFDYSGANPVDKNPSGSEPEHRDMFVLCTKDDKYYYAEKLEPHNAVTRPLQREMGFEVRFNPQYLAAENYWTDAEPAMYAEYVFIDYSEMLATVFLETDQFVKVTHTLGNYENKRILTLDVPDAELWYVTPGTIIDVNAAGSLVEYGGSNFIRDDRPRLRDALAAAVAWYGRIRNKITIQMNVVDAAVPIGTMLTNTDVSGVGVAGSCVTAVEWNFQNVKTTIMTDFTELDISAMFRKK